MHKLEYALLTLAKRTDDELAKKLSYLASVSHNYLPPDRHELDVPDDFEQP